MSRMVTIDECDTNCPRVSTTEGNLPASMVKKVPHWGMDAEKIVLRLEYFFIWDHECKALIRSDVHAMLRRGLELGGMLGKI